MEEVEIPNRDGHIPESNSVFGDSTYHIWEFWEIWKSDETFVTLKRLSVIFLETYFCISWLEVSSVWLHIISFDSFL